MQFFPTRSCARTAFFNLFFSLSLFPLIEDDISELFEFPREPFFPRNEIQISENGRDGKREREKKGEDGGKEVT